MKHLGPLALFASSLLCATALAQTGPPAAGCVPEWQTTFGALPGVSANGHVRTLAMLDDGSGPALFVGGQFGFAGGVLVGNVARWDGAAWASLEGGTEYASSVQALAVFDEGTGNGPQLFAGGSFTSAGGHNASRIARWNGSQWSPLGPGLNGTVHALEVFDEGSGPALFAGGSFTGSGGITAYGIARWKNLSWTPVGSGANGYGVHALEIFDDGSGPALYAAGTFTTMGGVPARRVARWDGASWSPLGIGTDDEILALEVYDDGSGPALYAGGNFSTAGGVSASRVARWDGQAWTPLGSGTNSAVRALEVFDSGSGEVLHVGGNFTQAGGVSAARVATFDGASWSPMGSGVSDLVYALEPFDFGDGRGERLAVGGYLDAAGEVAPAYGLAAWDGGSWGYIGDGLNGRVSVGEVLDLGSGPALYLGGLFTFGRRQELNHVARWDGEALAPLGLGADGEVLALAAFDDGGGPALYAGGAFTTAGGVAASRVARWDGTAWSPLASGLDGTVHALEVYDDGDGAALYAGGEFFAAGGVPASRVAKWDGATWSAVGSGTDDAVYALEVCELDGRTELYAGGEFHQAGIAAAYCIAKWNGSSWRDVGVGTSDAVRCLVSYDDGTGTALYVGGRFKQAIYLQVKYVARWDGLAWSALGNGLSYSAEALAVHDDGSGEPMLHAGGGFYYPGLYETGFVSRFDGASWTSLNAGGAESVRALASFEDPSGRSLYVGGDFIALGAGDAYLARWGCAVPPGDVYCACDGSGAPPPCGNAGGAGEGCANSTGAGAALAASGSASVAADDLALHASGMLPGQPALLFVGDVAVNGGDGVAFGDGLRCAGGSAQRLGSESPDASGAASWGPGLVASADLEPGVTARFQVWYRDPGASPCGQGFNLTNGFAVELVR